MLLHFWLLLLIAAPAASGYEYFCKEGSQPDWKQVEADMNVPGVTKDLRYTFVNTSAAALTEDCLYSDLLIVRTMAVAVVKGSTSVTRLLCKISGKAINEFDKRGELCHLPYGSSKITLETDRSSRAVDSDDMCSDAYRPPEPNTVLYIGRGEFSVRTALERCEYRSLRCGEGFYEYNGKNRRMWCVISLETMEATPFEEEGDTLRLLWQDLVCHIGENRSTHSVACFRDDCTRIPLATLHESCRLKIRRMRRLYSYTRMGSPWAHEAFKHFARNYLVVLIFYTAFMMGARRQPLRRRKLDLKWKTFMSSLVANDEEEPSDPAKLREIFMEKRGKEEAKQRHLRLEHLLEEAKWAKSAIAALAEKLNAPPPAPPAVRVRMTKRLRKIKKKHRRRLPCTRARLANLIQSLWIVEAEMTRAMKEQDAQPETYGMAPDYEIASTGDDEAPPILV